MDVIYPSTGRVYPHARGHTLVETMVSLSLAGILMALAAPAMGNLLADNQLTSQVNDLVSYLNYSRSEAIKSGRHIQVCKSADGENCNNRGMWENGWLVFVDADEDRQRDANETILKTHGPLKGSLTLDYSAFPTDNYVVYYPGGSSLGNGTFTFCDDRGSNAARALILYKTGRIRPSRTMPDGSTLSCRN